jgi:hypothetical protein
MAVLWRLGLGWLIGRWLLLVTTTDHQAAVPFRLFAGTFYLRAADVPWLDGAEVSATVQAWPGPRSVKTREMDIEEQAVAAQQWDAADDYVALSPTGQRSPEMVPPDLVWVWPVALGLWWLVRRTYGRS